MINLLTGLISSIKTVVDNIKTKNEDVYTDTQWLRNNSGSVEIPLADLQILDASGSGTTQVLGSGYLLAIWQRNPPTSGSYFQMYLDNDSDYISLHSTSNTKYLINTNNSTAYFGYPIRFETKIKFVTNWVSGTLDVLYILD